MERELEKIFPIMDVEHDCIVSRKGDITIAYAIALPEIFSLSDGQYEIIHHSFIKAIKVLPKDSIFHKQDWFVEDVYSADFERSGNTFLNQSSERFFNERPFLNHRCYIFLTKKASGRTPVNSILSSLIRPSIVPEEALSASAFQDFEDAAGKFERLLTR